MALSTPSSQRRGYFALALFWLAVHLLPFIWLADGRNYTGEIVQARSLLDYGFWARHGATMMGTMCVGVLPNPADFNYVNHPYPIVWLYTLLYWIFGPAGVFGILAFLGLTGCLVTYHVLKELVPSQTAWFVAALFTIAHANVEFATNTEAIAQSAILWPLAAGAILALRKSGGRLRKAAPWLAGLAVFVAGQCSWFALTAVPVLLLVCIPPGVTIRQALHHPASIPGWIPILAGAMATLAVFIGQIFAYSPNLLGNVRYLGAQTGTDRGGFIAFRLHMAPVLLLRALLAGPALWLGGTAGAILLLHSPAKSVADPLRRLSAIMLIYFVIFAAVTFAIPRLLFLNQHAFRFNVWPCAVLTAFALRNVGSKWLQRALIAVAVAGLLFCYAKIHDYRASEASVALGRWLAAKTKPTDIVFSNLSELTPPIQPWDGECFANANAVADRYMAPAVANQSSLIHAAEPFKGLITNAVFLLECTQPINPALESSITSGAVILTATNLPVPPERLAIFKLARASLWRLLGKNATQSLPALPSNTQLTDSFSLKLYVLSPEFIRELNKISKAKSSDRR